MTKRILAICLTAALAGTSAMASQARLPPSLRAAMLALAKSLLESHMSSYARRA